MFGKSFILVALVLTVAPAAAGAVSPPTPSQSCTAMRTKMTEPVFNTTYGANEADAAALGKCVSQQQRASTSAKASATAACRSEQRDSGFAGKHGGKSFARYYGGSSSTPFGTCVARKTRAMLSALSDRRVRAATACWGQRQASPDQFRSRWKSFAACVAGDAKIM
jgi:hypothetical protein